MKNSFTLTRIDQKILDIITDVKNELKLVYNENLTQIILFGSRARGDAQPDSDIDILVVLKGEINSINEIKKNSEIISNLCLEHDILINCMYLSENNLNNNNSPFVTNIKKEGIVL